MAPLNQILFPSSILRPVHMTLTGPHPGLRSLVRTLEDTYHDKPSHHFHEDVLSPSFDVRESHSAFYLEGEFPGVVRKEDITIERLGPRTLLVESCVMRFNVEAEWGQARNEQVQSRNEQMQPRNEQMQSRNEQVLSRVPADEGVVEGTDRERSNGRARPLAQREEDMGQDDGLRVRLAERHVGYLQRSFTFPCAVDIESLKARLRSGLLVLMVPKMKDGKVDSKRIDIED